MISPIFVISLGAAVTMIVFGINQLMHPEKWTDYMPSWLKSSSLMKPESSMRVHGVGNILFGIFLLFPFYPLVAAWIAFIWWLTILPFAFKHNWAIGMRDLSITLALLALILLR